MPNFDPTSASRAVLIEVMNVLGAFRDQIVVVGGWVPDLLYPDRGHMGSLDVDLAISRRALSENAYQTILQRLASAATRTICHRRISPRGFPAWKTP